MPELSLAGTSHKPIVHNGDNNGGIIGYGTQVFFNIIQKVTFLDKRGGPDERPGQHANAAADYEGPEPCIEHESCRNHLAANYSTEDLITAAGRGDLARVSGLISYHEVDVNGIDSCGHTALHEAAKNGQTEMCVALIKNHAANTRTKTLFGMTAMELAARNGHIGVIKAMVSLKPDSRASQQELLSRALLATANGRMDSAEVTLYLLDQGADVHAQQKCSGTPLHLAARNGLANVTRALLSARDINTNASSPHGRTALHEAAASGHAGIVRLLLDNGAEADTATDSGEKPLHAAIHGGHNEAFRILLPKTSNLDDLCGFGETALCMASEQGNLEMVEALLSSGANPTVESESGEAAMDIASRLRREDIVDRLRRAVYSAN
ncbi:Ankyrin-3 [Madurella mycetomatis]|uniref:Ankyrin-3 n=1 Tax=Madurella mycetomatis TaxID=100816 RepID=A0A175VXZ8_9PEZI|nr:Ankyrin-3 [Madurella mycetomatis]KXX83183.1 Ankyrin-3 [Madurella mycetomatis]